MVKIAEEELIEREQNVLQMLEVMAVPANVPLLRLAPVCCVALIDL